MNTLPFVNPKEVEAFMMQQEGILGARARFEEGTLTAEVTYLEGTPITERTLIALCQLGLGADKAPRRVTFRIARPMAVIKVA